MKFLFSMSRESIYLLETILDDCSLILRTQFFMESRIKTHIKTIIAHLLLHGTELSVLWTTQVMFDLTSQETDFYFMVD